MQRTILLVVLAASHCAADEITSGSSPTEDPPAPSSGRRLTHEATSEVTSDVTVSSGTYDGEVAWDLSCSNGGTPFSGGAPYGPAAHTMPAGSCTLEMWDTYGDGWNAGRLQLSDAARNVLISASLTAMDGHRKILDLQFSAGQIVNHGGGLHSTGGTLELIDTVVKDNSAAGPGGGIYSMEVDYVHLDRQVHRYQGSMRNIRWSITGLG